ncbi:MAG: hypothetical protein R3C30_02570 [Hyphomonadaceae bacterium]
MAKIYEAQINYDAADGIVVTPVKRGGGWAWGVLFAVFLVVGVTLGLALATGSLSNAIEVAQAGFAADGMSDTATN